MNIGLISADLKTLCLIQKIFTILKMLNADVISECPLCASEAL